MAETNQPIFDTNYWKDRLEAADKSNHIHHAVMKCSQEDWGSYEEAHRKILKALISPNDSVLDCGCAWGRLLELLPNKWDGPYLGFDLSPDLIKRARDSYPGTDFFVHDLRWPLAAIGVEAREYDWAVLISIRPMVIRNMGEEVWALMEANIAKYAKNLLFLEYDADDPGTVVATAPSRPIRSRVTDRVSTDGYDVARWPEFTSFAKRLGIDLDTPWQSVEICIAVGENPVITQQYLSDDIDQQDTFHPTFETSTMHNDALRTYAPSTPRKEQGR